MTPYFLAALRDGSGLVYLSERGTWMAPAAFSARGSTQKLRRFKYRESAVAIAEEFAKRAGCEAVVEEGRGEMKHAH